MVKRFNPDKRRRPKVDDYFGDWKWREALAESMVPIVGKLYRSGIRILMYGRPLLNCSALEIMKLHRFVREVEGNELSEIETYPVLEQISKMKLMPCEIDIGEMVQPSHQYLFRMALISFSKFALGLDRFQSH